MGTQVYTNNPIPVSSSSPDKQLLSLQCIVQKISEFKVDLLYVSACVYSQLPPLLLYEGCFYCKEREQFSSPHATIFISTTDTGTSYIYGECTGINSPSSVPQQPDQDLPPSSVECQLSQYGLLDLPHRVDYHHSAERVNCTVHYPLLYGGQYHTELQYPKEKQHIINFHL